MSTVYSATQIYQSEMPKHIKSEALLRTSKIQRTHWDSNIGLNEYVNRRALSPPSLPPTSSISQRSTPTDSTIQNDNQDDSHLLHPPPRTVPIPLHSRKSLRAALRANPAAKDWRPDNTIRLLPAIAHIKIDTAAGITLDPQYPPPPAVPKRERNHLEPRLLEVGFINDQLPQIDLVNTSATYRAQAPQLTPVFIWLHPTPTPTPSQKHQYAVVNPSGNAVDESSILWKPGLTTPEQRKEVVDQFLFECALGTERMDRDFEKRARAYRKERLRWEMALVRNEWVRRKNWRLFRPGTTGWGVGYALRLGGREVEREGEGKEEGKGGVLLGYEREEVEREMREWWEEI